jgi:hypothetical protein
MAWLTHPFVLGLGLGLILTVYLWIQGILKRRSLVKELANLKDHLHTHMEISAKGNESSKSELETLKKQTENLRITVATLKAKPGRAELRTLHVYDKALHMMFEKAPGFAPAWESILKEAEQEMEQTEKGFFPLIRKVFRPSLPQATSSATSGPGVTASSQAEDQVVDAEAKDE